MKNKIIDGHAHLHYGIKVSDEEIKEGLNEFQKVREKYSVEKIAGIFRQENVEVVKELEDNSIYPGVYVGDLNDLENLKKSYEDFEFVKIHDWLTSPDSHFSKDYLEKVIDESKKLGFKKFQIHTENIKKSFIDMIKDYIEKDKDLVFYLVHGVNSLYGYNLFPEVNSQHDYKTVKEMKRLENNVLLGTFPSSGYTLTYPNTGLQSAVKDGLKNLISFDSDFVLGIVKHNPDFYKSCIGNVTKSVGYNKKIFEENSKIFFE